MVVIGLDGTEYKTTPRFIDFTGKEVGKLKVLGISHKEGKHFIYKCQCFCGNTKLIKNRELKVGSAKTCGCVNLGKVRDLAGQIFGKLNVVDRNYDYNFVLGKVGVWWNCVCECGNTCVKFGQQLTDGEGLHCGCITDKPGNRLDITGNRFGGCVAVKRLDKKSKSGNFIWEFLCDCGDIFEAPSGNIVHKNDGRCSTCSRKKVIEATTHAATTHSMSKTKEYRSWGHAKDRCNNPSCLDYPRYGDKGVTFFEEWDSDFKSFIEHIGQMPKDGNRYTLDRIDHNGNYEPGNVRWALDSQQARNKGMSKNNTSGVTGVCWEDKLHPDGVTYTRYAIAQWNAINGKFCKKSYSVKKYGEELAFLLACEKRDLEIMKLNLQGAGYTENHGR